MATQTKTERLEITGLPLGTIVALEQLGKNNGKTGEEFARMLIEAALLAQQPFKIILAPIRQGFEDSGMSEDDLDAIVERAREDFYLSQHATNQ